MLSVTMKRINRQTADAQVPRIAPTPNGYVWMLKDESHELFVAFGTVHVKRWDARPS
jgi:hypothetical protein